MKTTIKDTNWRINFRSQRAKNLSLANKNTAKVFIAFVSNLEAFRQTGFSVHPSMETKERIIATTI